MQLRPRPKSDHLVPASRSALSGLQDLACSVVLARTLGRLGLRGEPGAADPDQAGRGGATARTADGARGWPRRPLR